MHAKYFIYQNKVKNDNNIVFLTYMSLLKKQLLIENEICLLRIKNTSLPYLTMYFRIYNVN